MDIQIITGQFKKEDALEIVTRMIDVKIKFHESKISGSSNEDDIKFRESKIKHLQKVLYDFTKYLKSNKDALVSLSGNISLN